MLNNIKKRCRSKAFWVSLVALVPLAAFGLGFDMAFIPDNYQKIGVCFLTLLGYMGVYSNPTTENAWFGDDERIEAALEAAMEIAGVNVKEEEEKKKSLETHKE